ncbi:DUF871 family protein [Curtobacterium flaccumfaciens pv. flaccumfaciens]|uniref:DUF871 family protein n=1 Tax=Curtobacterium flaccumfaciens pv. flaccumfaciens TaxID=138532 RepID=A0A9Q2ZPE7_9MICO|nr:DUF871 family protein [Curtobacterium flaccumfaciens pv. flaccumfaciens]
MSAARQLGWRVGAFIASDSVRRGPLGDGLPTVEEHRITAPLRQALTHGRCRRRRCDRRRSGADDVTVADPALTDHSWSRSGSSSTKNSSCSMKLPLPACTRRSSRHSRSPIGTGLMLPRPRSAWSTRGSGSPGCCCPKSGVSRGRGGHRSAAADGEVAAARSRSRCATYSRTDTWLPLEP